MRVGRVLTAHATVEDLEALRVPLTGYCYRLLGSAADTDDAVQETLIRAADRLDGFDPARAQLTTWVHRIATNICLDLLSAAKRRALVMDLEDSAAGRGLGRPLPPDAWIEPMPDSRLLDARDPGAVVEGQETVRLAFITVLQHLAPRQRAVLVLRDVLAFSARETAEILGTTVASVTSALQRARAVLAERRPDPFDVGDPQDAAQRALLRRYVTAFEAHDVVGLTAVLREDAIASMPPFRWRLSGARQIAEITASSDSCAGARLVLCRLNGGIGVGQYRPDDAGVLRPFALVALTLHDGWITQIITFLGTQDRFAEFGLPVVLDGLDGLDGFDDVR